MYSLLIHGTFLDNLAVICDSIRNESMICLVLLFVFILLAALTVMNMLIGVLCEVVSAVAATEKEDMLVSFVSDKLGSILKQLDENNDERISREEFLAILGSPDAARALDEVGVDPVGVVDYAEFIFDDSDGDDLAFSEFMEVVLRLRGSNTATVKDIVDLRKFIFATLDSLQTSLLQRSRRPSKISLRRPSKDRSACIVQTSIGASEPTQNEVPNDEQTVQKLEQRVARMEAQLTDMMGAVQQLGRKLSLPRHTNGTTHYDDVPTSLPHLLHVASEPCPISNGCIHSTFSHGDGMGENCLKWRPCGENEPLDADMSLKAVSIGRSVAH